MQVVWSNLHLPPKTCIKSFKSQSGKKITKIKICVFLSLEFEKGMVYNEVSGDRVCRYNFTYRKKQKRYISFQGTYREGKSRMLSGNSWEPLKKMDLYYRKHLQMIHFFSKH
jgi:hypothetical protein